MTLESPSTTRKTDRGEAPGPPSLGKPLLLVALILLALNLRSPITSIAPLLNPLQADLHLSETTVGVLTSLPVLCLGLFAFVAPGLGRRWSLRTLLVLSLVVLTVGALVRGGTSPVALFVGTVLVAAPIGVANVLIPGLIKRRFPHSVPRVSAFYSSALTFGAAAGPAVAVPLADATGSSWRTPLLILVVPLSVLTAVVVLFALRKEPPAPAPAAGAGRPSGLWRSALAWQVTVFFGVQALLSYTVFGWLPTIWQDHGLSATSAGLALSLCNAVGVVGAWILAVAGKRLSDQRPAGVTVACLTATGLLGVVLGPKPLLWPSVAVLGLGLGAGFALALSLFALRSPDPATTAALSAMGQGIGYLIGVLGPLGAGALHDATDTWTWPLAVLLIACAVQITVAFSAGKARTVDAVTR
ncbi:MFS transporter [Streptomyces acidiscabies]|uniref:MFS transporter n=1 Tax=Streptomyces acidiscabies TaxID=42234 RepID=A0AAP6EJP7_9ACTN|nr:MFS transporter [Streptomyces acidiscabies]MBZ3918011.1 MFS transporter [Streptomyces acidiscabies]MDX2964745.1 MFS transporter [Streptomyces acidiscabies]MDX3021869.1 MFS transporter [Streptomyces acidiscabies]MDX3789526.1 MFS transporter [Streptomyces acidiscabies]GAV37414.1 putative transporter YycB [Streptomyces acidiscabies]